jgi:hypothetical protein
MKKMILGIFMLSILFITLPSVQATDDPGYTGIGIRIKGEIDDFDGHIDMLVPKSDFEDEINDTINIDFIAQYPNYQDFEYLDSDSEWISYCAFVEGGSCHFTDWLDTFVFADSNAELESLRDVRFIHVDSEGKTVVISDVEKVPKEWLIFIYDKGHSYDVSTNEFDIDMRLKVDPIYQFVIIAVALFSIFFSLYRFLLHKLFKLKLKRNSDGILYYFIVNIVFIVVGFLLLNQFEFIARIFGEDWLFAIYLLILISIESVISYYLLFDKVKLFKFIVYTSLSYGVFALLFFV